MLRETLREWNDDKVPRLGAALAFYSMLSIGPLLLIAIAVAGAGLWSTTPMATSLPRFAA